MYNQNVDAAVTWQTVHYELETGALHAVLFYDTDELPIGRAAELGAHAAPLDELLGRADIVVLCVPGIPATERLIGEKELGLMKRSAILVNVSRVSSHSLSPDPFSPTSPLCLHH